MKNSEVMSKLEGYLMDERERLEVDLCYAEYCNNRLMQHDILAKMEELYMIHNKILEYTIEEVKSMRRGA